MNLFRRFWPDRPPTAKATLEPGPLEQHLLATKEANARNKAPEHVWVKAGGKWHCYRRTGENRCEAPGDSDN